MPKNRLVDLAMTETCEFGREASYNWGGSFSFFWWRAPPASGARQTSGGSKAPKEIARGNDAGDGRPQAERYQSRCQRQVGEMQTQLEEIKKTSLKVKKEVAQMNKDAALSGS